MGCRIVIVWYTLRGTWADKGVGIHKFPYWARPRGSEFDPYDCLWVLSVDGSSNLRGSWVDVVLEGSNGVLIEQSLRYAFKASNNHAECETLISGMLLEKELGICRLLAKSDSLLIIGQVSKEYQAKDPHLATSSTSKFLKKFFLLLTSSMCPGSKILVWICYPNSQARAKGEGVDRSSKRLRKHQGWVCGKYSRRAALWLCKSPQ